jgi:hypothetical protein
MRTECNQMQRLNMLCRFADAAQAREVVAAE